EVHRRRVGEHGLLDGLVDGDPARTLLERRVLAALRGARQGRLQLLVAPVRVLLLQDRRRARHVRGRHRRTGDGQVAVRVLADLLVDDAALGRGRGDVDAGRGDVRLDGAVGGRARGGKVRQLVVAVDGADGERGLRAARRTDRLGALVARG